MRVKILTTISFKLTNHSWLYVLRFEMKYKVKYCFQVGLSYNDKLNQ